MISGLIGKSSQSLISLILADYTDREDTGIKPIPITDSDREFDRLLANLPPIANIQLPAIDREYSEYQRLSVIHDLRRNWRA